MTVPTIDLERAGRPGATARPGLRPFLHESRARAVRPALVRVFCVSPRLCQGRDSYLDFANTNTIKGYVLVNARAAYTIGGCTLSLFVNNITGAKYYNNGYVEADGTRKLFVQAPTNVYAAFKYSF